VARSLGVVPVLLLGAALAACSSDSRLKKLTVGIPKDSALAVMGGEPARASRYLADGHILEALYFNKPGAGPDSVPDRKRSPVILVDGVLIAWGWKQWDSIAVANKIVVEK
jgi:hypothetical protein